MRLVGFTYGTHDVYRKTLKACRMGFFALAFFSMGGAFAVEPNSSLLTTAMDVARGGQFIQHPNNYPPEAWYHYDDYTCDYECMAIEYLYWCIVTNMGILADAATCTGIANEWEPCTPELFESTDVIMHGLITNPIFKIPQLAPDGNYCPNEYISGDINEDGTLNILDVVLLVDMILGD